MKRAIVVLLSLALAGALFAGMALAHSDNPPAGEFFQSFLSKLAANLGIDQGRLKEALKETNLQMIDEAVQQGRIPAHMAQELKSKVEEGQLFPHFHMSRPAIEEEIQKGNMPEERLQQLAQALGMSADELFAMIQQGKKLPDIAQEKGLTMEQLHQKLVELKIQSIRQAVGER